jgi:hypothetical protein
VRPYLKKTDHKKGLVECLKILEELSPSTTKKKKKKKIIVTGLLSLSLSLCSHFSLSLDSRKDRTDNIFLFMMERTPNSRASSA